MKRNFTLTAIAGVALLTVLPSFGFSPTCMVGIAQCVSIQGEMLPVRDVETIAENFRDFTRRNLGATVLRMSQKEILDRAGKNIRHPLLRASLAYDALHDSPLRFDRSLSIEQRYFLVKRACVFVFRAARQAIPSCRIPDDCIDPKRYPLFMGRAVMQELINSLKAQAQSSTGKGSPS